MGGRPMSDLRTGLLWSDILCTLDRIQGDITNIRDNLRELGLAPPAPPAPIVALDEQKRATLKAQRQTLWRRATGLNSEPEGAA